MRVAIRREKNMAIGESHKYFNPNLFMKKSQICTYFPSNLQGTTFLLIFIFAFTTLMLD